MVRIYVRNHMISGKKSPDVGKPCLRLSDIRHFRHSWVSQEKKPGFWWVEMQIRHFLCPSEHPGLAGDKSKVRQPDIIFKESVLLN